MPYSPKFIRVFFLLNHKDLDAPDLLSIDYDLSKFKFLNDFDLTIYINEFICEVLIHNLVSDLLVTRGFILQELIRQNKIVIYHNYEPITEQRDDTSLQCQLEKIISKVNIISYTSCLTPNTPAALINPQIILSFYLRHEFIYTKELINISYQYQDPSYIDRAKFLLYIQDTVCKIKIPQLLNMLLNTSFTKYKYDNHNIAFKAVDIIPSDTSMEPATNLADALYKAITKGDIMMLPQHSIKPIQFLREINPVNPVNSADTINATKSSHTI
jgi:hypothetical protein